jgi:ketosteroid isomerase-like protein
MRAAKQAKNQLRRIGTTIMGCILNGVPHSRGYYPYYYGYYGYYAYRYSYDEEPRKRPSVRELGLRIESGMKGALGSAQHAVPRYVASGGRFAWHIMRRASFWALLLLLIAVTGFHLYLRQSHPTKKEAEQEFIQYAGDEPSGPTPRNDAIRVIESPRPAEGAGEETPIPGLAGGDREGPEGGAEQGDEAFAYLDSIAVWAEAVNKRDSARYAQFYDPRDFRYPGGTSEAWVKDNVSKWLQDSGNEGIIRIDTAWAVAEKGPHYRTVVRTTGRGRAGGAKVERTMIWRRRDGRWRIVREKTEELR